MRKHLPLVLVLGLLTLAWAPVLFLNKILINAESVPYGIPLWVLGGRAFPHFDRLLWSHEILGGFPLLAEGQGGYFHPLNMLLLALFEPVRAFHVAQWAYALLGASGIFFFCRTLGCRRWSSAFAALAVSFSWGWLQSHDKAAQALSLASVPWLLWVGERWIQRPTYLRTVGLGLGFASMVFAGYPQYLHGCLVYLAASVPLRFASRGFRARFRVRWLRYLAGALGIAVIAAGISAVQFLPLLELKSCSIRAHGIALTPYCALMRPVYFLNGFFFSPRRFHAAVPGMGSLVFWVALALFPSARLSWRSRAHLCAVFFVGNLGFSCASPLFNFLYRWQLVPGLGMFRSMNAYLDVACIGLGLLAARGLDHFRRARPGLPWREARGWLPVAALVLLVADAAFVDRYVLAHLVFGALALGLAYKLLPRDPKRLPIAFFALLAVEVLSLKMHANAFGERTNLAPPPSATEILSEPDAKDYFAFDNSLNLMHVFMLPDTAPQTLANALYSLTNLNNVYWGIPKLEASVALFLGRQVVLGEALHAELYGETKEPIGQRLFDIWGVRHYFTYKPSSIAGMVLLAQRPHTYFLRNPHAKPRYQLYSRTEYAPTPQAALESLRAAQTPVLVLEGDGKAERLPASSSSFTVHDSQPRYQWLTVETTRDTWLFFADANYPGWSAFIDGKPVPVRTAQVMGKAVRVPAGKHEVVFSFASASFLLGARLTGATLLVLCLVSALTLLVPSLTRVRGRLNLLLPSPL